MTTGNVSSEAGNQWYVAQLKPNGFVRACENLRRQNFEIFMPVRLVTVRHARQLRQVRKPVFPGYIFVKFGKNTVDWRKINSTYGVARLVSLDSGRPSPVPDALIAGLKARCDASHVLLPMDDLKIGEKVRFVSGVFTDFIGRVDKIMPGESVRLLFEFMGQSSRLNAPLRDIERL